MKETIYLGEIADAHMHLWDRSNDGYSWLDQTKYKEIQGNFLIEDYFQKIKNQNITQAVHVECVGFPYDPVLETKWVQEIADEHGMPQGIVGHEPLDHPDIENRLKRHCEYPNFRGIRASLKGNKAKNLSTGLAYMQNKAWQYGFSLLSKYDLTFDMLIYPEQTPDVIKLLKVYDDIPVILNHLVMPEIPSKETFENWSKNVKQLAEIPTTYMKLSGIGQSFQSPAHFDLISKYVEHAIQIFGIERCMFGSNCPVDIAFIPFHFMMEIYKKICSKYSEEEQFKLFYQNTHKIYKI